MSERSLVDPTPELPDDTRIEDVRFATRIRNVLAAAGLKTVGEVRETAYETLLSFPDLGSGSIASLRKNWAFPQPTGSDPWVKSQPDLPKCKALRGSFRTSSPKVRR